MRIRRTTGFGTYIVIILITTVILIGVKKTNSGDAEWLITAPDSDNEQTIIFDVEKGESGKAVAKNLKEKNLINSYWKFYGYLKDNDLGHTIQAGRFVLKQSMSPADIIHALTSGAGQVAITIPEGFTLEQIDDRITASGLAQNDQFKDCAKNCHLDDTWDFLKNASSLEGYLFPDTFFLDPASYTNEGFFNRLLDNFETKFLTPQNQTAIQASSRTLNEIVIMASIVEREAFLDEDYTVIAGILWKRLDNDWPLDADATLLYVLDDPSDLVANLDLDSPYNSRKNRGLPPTAISNPGLTALNAALYPQDSPYWFYLNDQDTGKAHFATTNDEHNANKAKWLK